MVNSMSNYILEGRNLSKSYMLDDKILMAVRNVDFSIERGKTVGIVGESGCGKSTLLKLLTRLEPLTEGKLFFKNEDITNQKGRKLREARKDIQMVFQDPAAAFSPRMRVRAALAEPLNNFFKLSKQEEEERIKNLLGLVHLPLDFIDRYCHEMSGGQRQRLGIARALATEPEILVCDEATCALDVSIQDNIMKLLVEIQEKRSLSILFVCHDVALVASISHKIMIMYLGVVVEEIESNKLSENACHPYSKSLLKAIFSTSMDFSQEIKTLEGEVPNPMDIPKGCPFNTRCNEAMEICRVESPHLIELEKGHKVACHLFKK